MKISQNWNFWLCNTMYANCIDILIVLLQLHSKNFKKKSNLRNSSVRALLFPSPPECRYWIDRSKKWRKIQLFTWKSFERYINNLTHAACHVIEKKPWFLPTINYSTYFFLNQVYFIARGLLDLYVTSVGIEIWPIFIA